ncbi:histone-lysine N-methyltransferase ATXR6 [Dendrobium catenatum]|uniref:[histone H3]-lysine(27) N-methyltransferase n=1 Tax=Dendrobium catenatum TaxID=906689 RepID=A0A2I0WMQ0_9ASPA|nr:histone-lysine N-methyltransferase ATXR6 [Dendrobium catenatum]PKU76940.1 Histone-lysine N-methyltransferase ATXR6 [Dendrobium catenatum]
MAAIAPKTPFRRRTQARSLEVYEEARIDAIACNKCHSGDCADELILCDGCDIGFHLFCLRPILACVPYGSWFCPSCSSNKNPKPFPLIQTKIVDFFRIQRSTGFEKPESRKRKKRQGVIVVAKKKRKMLPYSPSESSERRMEQMASLATALTTTGAVFSDKLTYCPGMAPRSANRAELEHGGMQVLSKEDAEALNLCKRMMERGECPPLLVVFDPCEGFTVEADKFIKDLTIITEYVGDVDFLKNRKHDDGDSMMTLLSAKNPSRSLVICPDKHSNIARYINGINNYTQEGKKKQNLKCVRYDVDCECRVLLVANRDISKGERLYYDYNGHEQEYPTHHFV